MTERVNQGLRDELADAEAVTAMTPQDAFALETLGAMKSDFATPENAAAMMASAFIPGGIGARIVGEGVLGAGVELAETPDRIEMAGVLDREAPSYLQRGAVGFAFGAAGQTVIEGGAAVLRGASDPATRGATFRQVRQIIPPRWRRNGTAPIEAEATVRQSERAIADGDGAAIPRQLPPSLPDFTALKRAVIRQESNGDPNAVSPAGAIGLMQLMPATARDPGYGVPNVFETARALNIEVPDETDETLALLLKNPEVNETIGTAYLQAMTREYPGDLPAVLTAYNAGPGRADQWIRKGRQMQSLPSETQTYIKRIEGFLSRADARGPKALDDDTILTPDGAAHRIRYELVEQSELTLSHIDGAVNPAYPSRLQPRDRGRSASEDQIETIARQLEPRLLGRSPSASDGAIIVEADGAVSAGNGRGEALRRAYDRYPDRADAYRAYLEGEGFDLEGFTNPVLIRRRIEGGDIDEQAAFASISNARTTAASSASERARGDADGLSDDAMALYEGGDLSGQNNIDFVKAAVASVPASERPALYTGKGTLSAAGEQRLNEMILARAYDDKALLELALEAPDAGSRTVIGALRDVAPAAARLRASIRNGAVPEGMDVSGDIARTVQRVQQARASNTPVRDVLDQRDLMRSDPDGLDEALTRMIFADDDLTRLASRKAMSDRLGLFLQRLRAERADAGLFGDDLRLSAGTIARDVLKDSGIEPPPLRADMTPPPPTQEPRVAREASAEAGSAEGRSTETPEAETASSRVDENGPSEANTRPPAAPSRSRGDDPIQDRRARMMERDLREAIEADPDFATTIADPDTDAAATVQDVLDAIEADADLAIVLDTCTLGSRA